MNIGSFFGSISEHISKIAYIEPVDNDSEEAYTKADKPKVDKSADGETADDTNAKITDQKSTRSTSADAISLEDMPQKAIFAAKNFGNALFDFATKATSTVAERAVHMKETFEKKTIIGDFEREQEKFIEQQNRSHSAAAIPPWVGYNEELVLKKQILALSLDSRNFLRDPPVGIEFHFDFNAAYPVAMATLEEDPNLKKMRFQLVPKSIKEDRFWRNYFYRVSLITQSTQLSALSTTHAGDSEDRSDDKSSVETATVANTATTSALATPSSNKALSPVNVQASSDNEAVDDEKLNSPAEFLSDEAVAEANVTEEELQQLRQQLGIEAARISQDSDSVNKAPASEDWERDLVAELHEYELVTEQTGKTDEEWEQEISELLQAEADVNQKP